MGRMNEPVSRFGFVDPFADDSAEQVELGNNVRDLELVNPQAAQSFGFKDPFAGDVPVQDLSESVGPLTSNTPPADDALIEPDESAINPAPSMDRKEVFNKFGEVDMLTPYEPTFIDRVMGFFPGDRARAANEYAISQIAKENNQTRDEVLSGTPFSRPIFNPEGEQTIRAGVESATAAGKSLADIPTSIANTALRAIRGGDVPVQDKTWLDKAITATTIKNDNLHPNYAAFQTVGESLGYSMTTMVASTVSAMTATALTGGNPVAGGTAAMGTAGAVSYRSSKDQFLTMLRDRLNDQSKQVFGQPLEESMWKAAMQEFDGAATKYGAWEAVPESVSNLIFLRAFTAPLKSLRTAQKVEEVAKRAATTVTSEMTTETMTGVGQSKALVEGKLATNEKTIKEAFKDQFVATLFNLMGMGGSVKAVQMSKEFYDNVVLPRINPESALAKEIEKELNDVANTFSYYNPQIDEETTGSVELDQQVDPTSELQQQVEQFGFQDPFADGQRGQDFGPEFTPRVTIDTPIEAGVENTGFDAPSGQFGFQDPFAQSEVETVAAAEEPTRISGSSLGNEVEQEDNVDYIERRREKLKAIVGQASLEAQQNPAYQREQASALETMLRNRTIRESEMSNAVQDVLERRALIQPLPDSDPNDQTFELTDAGRESVESVFAEMNDAGAADQAPSVLAQVVDSFAPTEQTTADRVAAQAPQVDIDIETTVATPVTRTPINFEFDVIEADELVAASGELQPRDRTRAGSDSQIRNIASNLDPQELGASRKTDTGAPIINNDRVVESGNGRVAAIKLHYEEYGDSSGYRRFVETRFPQAANMRQPILVRRRTTELTPEQVREFVLESNQDNKLQMSSTETAQADAQKVTSNTMGLWRGGEVTDASNRDFVRSFIQNVVPKQQQNGVIDAQGNLSLDGKRRIEAAMIAKAYGDASLLTKLIESVDNNIRSLGGALLDVSGLWANMRDAIADGRVPERFDITEQLVEAVRLVDQLRETKQKPSEFLSQGDMLNERDPVTTALIKSFFNENMTRAVGRQGVYDALKMYADDAVQQSDESLFGDLDQVDPTDLVDRARETANAQRNQGEQTGLFDRGPDAARESNQNVGTQKQSATLREDREGADVDRKQRTNQRQETVQAQRAGAQTQQDRGVDRGRADRAEAGQQQGVQQERAAPQKDNEAQPSQTFRGTREESIFEKVSFTDRQSIFRDAFVDMGYTIEEAELLSPARQYELLRTGITNRFGLAFVEKTKRTNIREVIDQLLDAYRGLQNMSFVLGLPESEMGLGGNFGLLLRKGVQYLGAYYPAGTEKGVEGFIADHPFIVLPRRSNSFAHEWGHALDHLLIKQRANIDGYVSHYIRSDESLSDIFPESVNEAFALLMRSMFFDRALEASQIMELEQKLETTKGEKTKKKLQDKLDKIKRGASQSPKTKSKYYRSAQQMTNQSYWVQPTEMLARAFEAFISFKVEANGRTTEFIGKGVDAYQNDSIERLRLTFPKDEDRANIFRAFDLLFEELKATGMLNRFDKPSGSASIDAMIDDPSKYFDEVDTAKGKGVVGRFFNREKQGIKKDIQRHRNWLGRPKDPRSRKERIIDSWKAFAHTNRQVLLMIESKYKRAGNNSAAKTIWEITRRITTDPGASRTTVVGGTYNEAVFRETNRFSSRLENIIKSTGIDTFTADQLAELKQALTAQGDAATRLPEKIKKAASGLRILYNDLYAYLKAAGVDIGYVEDQNYLTRILDEALVIEQQSSFIGDAARVYDVLFDKEVGTDMNAANVLDMDAKMKELAAEAGFSIRSVVGNENYKDFIQKIRFHLRALATAQNADDKRNAQSEIDNLIDDYRDDYAGFLDAVKRQYSDTSAHAWMARIISGNPRGFNANYPSAPKQTKTRKLPAEADTILANYYLQDPTEAIQKYLHTSVRKAEYNRRFGAKPGKKTQLTQLQDDLVAAGVTARDISYINSILNQEVGATVASSPIGTFDIMNKVHTLGTMALLGRVLLTSIAEPVAAGMQTGSFWGGMRAFLNTIREIAPTQSIRERRALARAMGIVSTGYANEVLQNRFGGQFKETQNMSRLSANYYARIGLTGWTNATRRASMDLGVNYFVTLSETINDPSASAREREYAKRELLDFGVQQSEIAEFTQWMEQFGDRMPTPEDITDRTGTLNDFGLILTTAVSRLVDQSIQNTKPADRPWAANTQIGKFSYGLLSFNMSFFRNVVTKSYKKVARESEAQGKLRAAEIALKNVALPAAGLYMAHFMVTVMREAIFNADEWDKHVEEGDLLEWLMAKAGVRVGATGILDPVIQAATGLKYERDLANIPMGAVGSHILLNIGKIANFFIKNSDNTNTAEWNVIKALYETPGQYGLAALVGALPGGPSLGLLYGLGYGYVSSPTFKTDFINTVYGEKDSKKKGNSKKRTSYEGIYF